MRRILRLQKARVKAFQVEEEWENSPRVGCEGALPVCGILGSLG